MAGRMYISNAVADKMVLGLQKDHNKHPHEILSDREFQVMCMIAQGESTTNISKELSLSVNTVSTYRARILEKMGLKSNSEIVRYALENKIID